MQRGQLASAAAQTVGLASAGQQACNRTKKTITKKKFYFDELYEDHVTKKWFYRYIAGGTDWIDRNIVDKVGLMVGFLGRNVGGVIGGLESGQIQAYGTGMSMGVIIIVIGFMLWA